MDEIDLNLPDIELQIEQQEESLGELHRDSIEMARKIYLSYFYLQHDKLCIKKAEARLFVDNVLVPKFSDIDYLDSVSSQILAKICKTIYKRPYELADALSSAEDLIDFPQFAFVTFPAIFGFFTTQEGCDAAASCIFNVIAKISDDHLYQLMLSYSLSMYSISILLWESLRDLINNIISIDDEKIHASILKSICCVSQNIPTPLYLLYSELQRTNQQLLIQIFCEGFLNTTFDLWLKYSPYATTFRYGKNVSFVIHQYKNNLVQGKEIIDAIFKLNKRTFLIPSFVCGCGFNSEVRIWSWADMKCISIIFKQHASNYDLYDKFSEASLRPIYQFKPFQFTLHFNKNLSLKPFKFFQKDDKQNLLSRLDMLLTLRFNQRQFQKFKSFLNEDSYFHIQAFISSFLDYNYPAILLPKLAHSLQLFTSKEISTNVAFCAYVLSFSHLNYQIRIPHHIQLLFSKMFLRIKKIIWAPKGAALSANTQRYFSKFLAPVPHLNKSEMFRRITYFGDYYRKLSIYNLGLVSSQELYMLFITSMDPVDVFESFLFFEQIIFRDPKFLKTFPDKISVDWSNYFQTIWEMIRTDQELLDLIIKSNFFG